MSIFKADEATRRTRLSALQAALHHTTRIYVSRETQVAASTELRGYECFTAAQINEFIGARPYADFGPVKTRSWGIRSIRTEQLRTAIELQKNGIEGIRPKPLIYEANKEQGMSFDCIGALLSIHKNEVSRIVKRIDHEPWT
jgi:hypothetical protein